MMKLQIVKRIPRLPPRKADSHKGDYGRVLVIGGSRGMIGAPALCANAAMRSGAGLVRIATEYLYSRAVGVLAPCATVVPHRQLWAWSESRTSQRSSPLRRRAMRRELKDAWTSLSTALAANDVVVIGPGWGTDDARTELLRRIVRGVKRRIVLDADGLNNLAKLLGWVQLCARRTREYPLVLTPHPGEMQRLLDSAKIRLSAIEQRREAAVRLSEDTGAIVVLKGHRTIVTDGRRLYENRTGNPGMATGGTGDVLTGVIAALIGQKMSPFDAAVLGVYVHGLAGDLAARKLGQVSLIATDMIEFLPAAFLRMRPNP